MDSKTVVQNALRARARKAVNAVASHKSLSAIDDVVKAIDKAIDAARSAYETYCREIGREKPNPNVKGANSDAYKTLCDAKSKCMRWSNALYDTQRAF